MFVPLVTGEALRAVSKEDARGFFEDCGYKTHRITHYENCSSVFWRFSGGEVFDSNARLHKAVLLLGKGLGLQMAILT